MHAILFAWMLRCFLIFSFDLFQTTLKVIVPVVLFSGPMRTVFDRCGVEIKKVKFFGLFQIHFLQVLRHVAEVSPKVLLVILVGLGVTNTWKDGRVEWKGCCQSSFFVVLFIHRKKTL